MDRRRGGDKIKQKKFVWDDEGLSTFDPYLLLSIIQMLYSYYEIFVNLKVKK